MKKILIISLLLIAVLSLSAVSANDNTTSDEMQSIEAEYAYQIEDISTEPQLEDGDGNDQLIDDYDFYIHNLDPGHPLCYEPNGVIFFGLPKDITGNITAFIDGEEIPYDITNDYDCGNYNRGPNFFDGMGFDFAPVYYNGLQLGNHTITVKYSGDNKYSAKSATETLYVNVHPEFGCSYFGECTIGSQIPITINLPEGNIGNFSVYIADARGENFTLYDCVNLTNSSATIYYNCTRLGEYGITTEYDTNYDNYGHYRTITVTGIEFPDDYIDSYSYFNYPVSVNLPTGGEGNFSLYISKDWGNFTLFKCIEIVNGTATINFKTKEEGIYQFEAICDSNYGFENKTRFESFKDYGGIDASDANVFYNDAGKYSARIYGENGVWVAKNTEVTVKIGATNIKAKTNAKGVATVDIPKLKPGTYPITVTYNNHKLTRELTVKHVIALKSIKVKKSAKKLTLQATLKNKNPLKGKTVTFKFNGKTYKAKTNSKGIAKATIKSTVLKKLKAGKKVTYQATYLKDTIKKTVKIQK